MSQIPPTQFDGSDFREPARWPKVVGIISIVWGSLFLLCGGCGLASPMITNFMTKGAEAQFGEPFPTVLLPSPMQMVLTAATLPVSLLLIVAGATCVSRKKVTVPLHVVYAIISIIITMFSTYAGLMQLNAIEAWKSQNPNSKWFMQGGGTGGMIFGMAFGLILGLGYPAFSIIWFGAIKRKSPDLGAPKDDADVEQLTT